MIRSPSATRTYVLQSTIISSLGKMPTTTTNLSKNHAPPPMWLPFSACRARRPEAPAIKKAKPAARMPTSSALILASVCSEQSKLSLQRASVNRSEGSFPSCREERAPRCSNHTGILSAEGGTANPLLPDFFLLRRHICRGSVSGGGGAAGKAACCAAAGRVWYDSCSRLPEGKRALSACGFGASNDEGARP